MTDSRLAIIVLAAGQGTRMKSALPKLLHPLAGVPIVGHVFATARELDAAHVITVVRHERDRLAALVAVDLPESVVVARDIADTGNTSAASIPLATERLLREGQVSSGALALQIGFGAGLVYAAQVVVLP